MNRLAKNDELVRAANGGDFETVKRLIEQGADPNSVDQYGMGPLLTFHPDVMRYLLEHGADPDVQRNENIAPVILGVCGHFECLRLLVESGADVNRASDHNGETALHGVAGHSDTRAVRLLLDHGANPNARTKPGMKTYMLWRDARVRGETPLHRAAAWGSGEVIQLLLDAGADPTIRDANQDTPLSWASWHLRDKTIIDQLSYEGSGVGPDFPSIGSFRLPP
ncbi:MAG: ankyrin repeat domain-containing protein [Planctomycetaceae bacterium]|nr:ankyrin repeat domain-containing protein [Planctomycetaceae bacterium]